MGWVSPDDRRKSSARFVVIFKQGTFDGEQIMGTPSGGGWVPCDDDAFSEDGARMTPVKKEKMLICPNGMRQINPCPRERNRTKFQYAMKIQRRVIEIYQDDFRELIDELKRLNKDKRMKLYELHARRLFPKSKMIVNLEDQLKGHKDYIHKFKRCFFIIGNDFFSTNRFGEYNQELFIKKTGFKSQRYPQKVILALSMMGYIKGLQCGYSTSNHGYIYEVDYLKYRNWNQVPLYEDAPMDEPDKPDVGSEIERAWLLDKQIKTIKSIRVDNDLFLSLMKKRETYLSNPQTKTSELQKELNHIYDLESIHYKTDSAFRVKIDGEQGRLYSVMTRLKSDYRVDGTLYLKGERFCEVDISSAQPALLGIILKEKHPDIQSQWLEHCLAGDFYKWFFDITGMENYAVEQVVDELLKIDYVRRWTGSNNHSLKRKAENNRKIVDRVSEIEKESKEKHRLFRPVVKSWIMRFLFCKDKMTSTAKDGRTIYKHFCHNLCTYLKENEPLLYEMLCWYRCKENHIPKKRNPDKTTSALYLKLQQEEVRYIKACLRNLDSAVEYLYTVHDCIGCLVSDAEKVKAIMERTSMAMYGVKLNLKIKEQ